MKSFKRFILFVTLSSLFLLITNNSANCVSSTPAVNWPSKETTNIPEKKLDVKSNDHLILNDIKTSKKRIDTDDVDFDKFARQSKKFDRQLSAASKKSGLPKKLIAAVTKEESGFDTTAKSGKGAEGLMQLKKAAQKEVGVKNPYNPDQNIEGGALYLKKMCEMFDDSLELGLLAYKIGPEALKNRLEKKEKRGKKKTHGVSRSSIEYVSRIMFLSENA